MNISQHFSFSNSMRIILTTSLLASILSTTPLHALNPHRVEVIAHRGDSVSFPEHTLAAYGKAIALGADYIEPDIVITKDGILIARHENEISHTTDVAEHPEFANHKVTRAVDGRNVEGWFTEDFTLAELKTLRVKQRLPQLRGTAHDGQFQIVTLAEIIDFTAAQAAIYDRTIGLIPETKHPVHFRQINLPLEARLLDTLQAHQYTRTAPVIIQSFDTANLKAIRQQLTAENSNIRLAQLTGWPGQPKTISMHSAAGLKEIASYADILSPYIRNVIPLNADKTLGQPTSLVADAHAAGLLVIPFTFSPENKSLPSNFQNAENIHSRNVQGSAAEIRTYLATGIDGFFTDDVTAGRLAVDDN